MLDDDFRYGNLDSSTGCLCDNHIAYMSDLLGEKLSLDFLRDKLFTGEANKYRRAWLESKAHFFRIFSEDMRAAVDEVNPSIRLGLCSSYCSWDQDGITPYELSKILAGTTKPFLRLSGAPFWAARRSPDNHTLQDTIEFARLQLSFIPDDTAEVFSEDDSYPRPRWRCPASYIEGFDQALRVSGGSDGVLKYTMDYTSTERYETGYNALHIKNLSLYDKIDEMFGSKKCIGLRVFEHREKYEDMDIPEWIASERELEFYTAFSYASRMLSAATIPSVYEDTDTVGIAFGENAKYLPDSAFKNGLILDTRAAEILTERGIDVGIVKKGKRTRVIAESFRHGSETVDIGGAFAYELTLRDGATVESTFTTFDPSAQTLTYPAYNVALYKDHNEIVGSYTYENANGERFLVFAFDGQLAAETLFRSYARADQLKRVIPYLGKCCGLTVCTSPHLYTIAKQDSSRVAVALWNFSCDFVEEPYIRIDSTQHARITSTVGCTAEISDGRISLSRLEPFGFAAVEYELM